MVLAFAFAFVYAYLPETRGCSVDDIQSRMASKHLKVELPHATRKPYAPVPT